MIVKSKDGISVEVLLGGKNVNPSNDPVEAYQLWFRWGYRMWHPMGPDMTISRASALVTSHSMQELHHMIEPASPHRVMTTWGSYCMLIKLLNNLGLDMDSVDRMSIDEFIIYMYRVSPILDKIV